MSYTPGPWKVQISKYGQFIVPMGVRSFVLARLNACPEGLGRLNQEECVAELAANAQLIAEAPSLLEALDRLCDPAAGEPEAADWESARAAVRRAKGL